MELNKLLLGQLEILKNEYIKRLQTQICALKEDPCIEVLKRGFDITTAPFSADFIGKLVKLDIRSIYYANAHYCENKPWQVQSICGTYKNVTTEELISQLNLACQIRG